LPKFTCKTRTRSRTGSSVSHRSGASGGRRSKVIITCLSQKLRPSFANNVPPPLFFSVLVPHTFASFRCVCVCMHLQDKWGTPLWRRQQLLFGGSRDLAYEIKFHFLFSSFPVAWEKSVAKLFSKRQQNFFYFFFKRLDSIDVRSCCASMLQSVHSSWMPS
jgi:hypothetical protein